MPKKDTKDSRDKVMAEQERLEAETAARQAARAQVQALESQLLLA